MEDRRHVHKHVLDFNMKTFEKYFCDSAITNTDLFEAFEKAQKLDRRVGRYGHWSVPRLLKKRIFKKKKTPLHITMLCLIESKILPKIKSLNKNTQLSNKKADVR